LFMIAGASNFMHSSNATGMCVTFELIASPSFPYKYRSEFLITTFITPRYLLRSPPLDGALVNNARHRGSGAANA